MAGERAQVEMDGHRFSLTNLSKVLYPATGTTKADVIGYFAEVAPAMIPLIEGRPVTRKRWPNGVGTDPFFHKNVDKGFPSWIPTREIRHSDRVVSYPLIESAAALAWMGQNASLELHVPQWKFTPDGERGNPDRAVFDLDPGPEVGLAECAEVARAIRERLTDLKLVAYPVTSGSKGLHLYVPLPGRQNSEEVSTFARLLAETVEQDMPSLVVSKMAKVLRPGKVFIDWSQNNGNKTTIAPYSLRGRDHPTVAAPRTWEELEDPDLRHLEYREVLERLRGGLNPFDVSGSVSRKLAAYRSKRSADRTPEPVPGADAPAPAPTGHTFVIQEHHATALHWDFRLEHEGVLVSWAVPRGIPHTVKENRLAVQTEDHPLEYKDFEGSINHGEYGGGDVTIWDSGTYELEKWRDGEVIVTLFGKRATGRFALIRTRRGAGPGDAARGNQWLMHRTKGQSDLEPVVPQEGRKFGPDRKIAHPRPPTDLRPMLASPGVIGDLSGDDWRFEGKWDGVRAIVEVADDYFRLVSRNGNDVTASYPELRELSRTLAGHVVVLDGEIVAMDADGRSDFGLLQRRMKLTRPADIARVAPEVPVRLLVFDILYLDGVSLLRKTYDDRRRLLEALRPGGGPVSVPDQLPGPAVDALAHSIEQRWEGIVAKKAGSTYMPGKRSHTWIKVKNTRDQEMVIVGWRPGKGRRADGIGGVLMGLPSGDGFRYIGAVGSGFSDVALDDLLAELKPLARNTSPISESLTRAETLGVQWVRPTLVGEVVYSEWTPEGRLRHPVWRGLRPDKSVDDLRP
ncbi:ATP-dependent DNA ligase LigD ligase module /ATP-dependent DNA ligase LigD phosphoesterase module /ATP-dependent DNA ligase LigD polymerase module [Nakamurella panacisegetis]|uniref:DNA ligase (ATP) n=1 Tax=Nakamurella panacisegetis TaxID=1090615 RepID=A0A1H0KEX1_9ACTN|nr:ATP-dependent DNA ligase [Nakamurella panacisegetis]SDO54343.1 ATP-dependent DNA ligase LigD ligase module /ATP-dependent DNA ligase LigD phosphoesterase module /ATP-dependent DNA ligase LigD polymerase module [Nakamurella panacisegetis]